jgi:antitoxin MazE
METRVQKWGDTLAVRIPPPFADEVNIREDSPVDIIIRGREIVVTLLITEELTLESLLDRVTDANRHEEIGTGSALGTEAW